jgi:large subunit ribosomal protein L25
MKLAAKTREITGKKVKNLRAQGIVPATVYGPKRSSTNIQIDRKEASKIYNEVGYNQFFTLEIDTERPVKVLFKEVTLHPLKNEVLNIGFYQIDEESKISVEVPIHYIGEAPAVKNNQGFLVTTMDSVLVHCLPKDLPKEFEIDISSLELEGDSIAVSAIQLPEGVEFDAGVGEDASLVYIAAAQKVIEEEAPVVAEGELNEDGTPKVPAEGEAAAEEGEKKE